MAEVVYGDYRDEPEYPTWCTQSNCGCNVECVGCPFDPYYDGDFWERHPEALSNNC